MAWSCCPGRSACNLSAFSSNRAEHTKGTFRFHSFRRLMPVRNDSWSGISVSYHFHEEEAGGVDGDVGRVLLSAGLSDEAHDDHRRRRQEQELDGQKLDAPFFL